MLCQSLRNSSKSPVKSSVADSRIQKDLHELATQRWTANCSVRITFPSTPNTPTAANAAATSTATHHAAHTTPPATPHLHVLITPNTGAYAHSSFLFSLHLPSSYPFSPPHARCLTPCLHPLLSFRTGRIHHPILHSDWKPVLSLNTVIFALQLLFHLGDWDACGGVGAGMGAGGRLDVDGDVEVRRLMEGGGGGLFDVLVQQTLDGGFYFGMRWERNRGPTAEEEQQAAAESADAEERKDYSPRQRPKRAGWAAATVSDEADDDARKRRRGAHGGQSAAAEDERGADEACAQQEDEDDDDRHRKHKQPHRHFLHRQATSTQSPPPALHAVHRMRRALREERKEADGVDGDDDDDRMMRADSFSFRALQSSLPGPHSPPAVQHSAAVITPVLASSSSSSSSSSASSLSFAISPSYVHSPTFSSPSSHLFCASSSSSRASSVASPGLSSLAAMQRQHAMRTTLGSSRRGGAVAAGGDSGSACDGSTGAAGGAVSRMLSSVMAD